MGDKEARKEEVLPKVNYEYKGAPYYNVDFIGGFDLVLNDQTRNPDYYINFAPYNKEGVIWCNITGHSMEPELNNGDFIAMKEMHSPIQYLPADRDKFISAKTLGTCFDRAHLLLLFKCNAAEKEKQRWRVDDPMDALYIKSNLRLVVNLQGCVKASRTMPTLRKSRFPICSRWHRRFSMCRNTGMVLMKNSIKLQEVLTKKWQ